MFRITILVFVSQLFFAGCNNHEEVTVKYIDNDPVYFDYKVWGEEDRNYVTILLQYRMENAAGTTRELESPAEVEFDGRKLPADSSKMSGFFYEMEQPLDSFPGKHQITYTDSSGRKFNESFHFSPFSLKSPLPATVHRSDLVIPLNGLKEVDYIRVIALDTSFRSRGINEVDTVRDGRLVIGRSSLADLVNGTIHLELYKEEEWPVTNATTAGGYLSLSYGLKREFFLTD